MFWSNGKVKLTQEVTIMTKATRTGPRRFQRPLRSNCIAMEMTRVPAINNNCNVRSIKAIKTDMQHIPAVLLSK